MDFHQQRVDAKEMTINPRVSNLLATPNPFQIWKSAVLFWVLEEPQEERAYSQTIAAEAWRKLDASLTSPHQCQLLQG